MAAVIKFNCLTGLRPAEAVESVRLINGKDTCQQYYNPERLCLEHFRFPEIFLRRTKKAYLSFITREQLSAIGVLGCKTPTHNAIRLACRKRSLKMDMRYCRKLFASWLRHSGIQPEIIDLLQGRVSQSILTRHYLVPKPSFKEDVLQALEQLQQQLD
jgi:intergrase/recombinase